MPSGTIGRSDRELLEEIHGVQRRMGNAIFLLTGEPIVNGEIRDKTGGQVGRLETRVGLIMRAGWGVIGWLLATGALMVADRLWK